MVSSNFLKILEYCLLPRIKNCISLCCHQFGYRKATSTLMATGCFLGINKINILAYTDDLVLLSATSTGLQVLLNKIESFLDRLKLNVNVDKTVSMIFNRKKNLSDAISFSFNGRVLSRVLKYKYLGCILSTDLSDEEDIVRSIKS